MEGLAWEVVGVTLVTPAVIVAAIRYLPDLLRAWTEKTLTSAELDQRLRSAAWDYSEKLELRIQVLEAENGELKDRVSRLETENGVHVGRITRLEAALRDRGHHDVLEDMG